MNLDPLVLVIPLLITARAHSHSVQSMERYHEEYHRLRDKDAAIVKSYTEIYAPAMVSLMADGLAVLTLLVARIPMIQKLAWLCFFWIASIFVSVVTLHPIILAYTPPPEEHSPHRNTLERFMSWMMLAGVLWLLWLYGWLPGRVDALRLAPRLAGHGAPRHRRSPAAWSRWSAAGCCRSTASSAWRSAASPTRSASSSGGSTC